MKCGFRYSPQERSSGFATRFCGTGTGGNYSSGEHRDGQLLGLIWLGFYLAPSASPSDVVFKEAKIAVLPALPTVGNTGGSLGESETDSSP